MINHGGDHGAAAIDDELVYCATEAIRGAHLSALFGLVDATDEVDHHGQNDKADAGAGDGQHGAGAFKEYFHGLLLVDMLIC